MMVFKFCIHPDSGEVCCEIETKGAEIYFFCLSLSCNTKGNLHLQNWFKIPLIATAGVCELCSLYSIQ